MAEVARSLVDSAILELIYGNVAEGGDRDDIQEMAFYRLEKIGFSMGEKLIAKLLSSTNTTPPTDQLQIIKYICCEFWQFAFGKQIDSLKTNHRGVYVLTDNDVSILKPFVVGIGHPDVPSLTVLYLALPCGLLRGALSGFRLKSTVKAQLTSFPICSFDVQVVM